METTYTKGPLTVGFDTARLHDIVTVDATGRELFRRILPAQSSSNKTRADALNCRGLIGMQRGRPMAEQDAFMAENIAANHRAVFDEVLRAAAPTMLEMLSALVLNNDMEMNERAKVQHRARNLLMAFQEPKLLVEIVAENGVTV
jgi:hypothetical protein